MSILNKTIEMIRPLEREAMIEAKKRFDQLIKPVDSLGKMETMCIQMAGIFGSKFYDTSKKLVLSFAADHGIYEENVSPCKQDVTILQFSNFVTGGNGVRTISKFSGSHVWAIDVGINSDIIVEGAFDRKIRKSTSNMAKGPAMTREEAIRSLEIGIEFAKKAKEEGYSVLGIGEMGICNTTPSTAIMSVFCGFEPAQITGMGCGLDSEGIVRKTRVIEDSLRINQPDKSDPVDVLAKVGGFEIGAMAGAIIGAAAYKLPMVIDGFIAYAAALLAYNLNPLSQKYMIASHMSAEPASNRVLNMLGLSPMLNLDMKLGEGSGAAMAFNIIEASNFTYKNMLTFDESNMENTHPETEGQEIVLNI